MAMPSNLYLVRHGQSEMNLVRKKFEETGDDSFYSDEFLSQHESQYRLTPQGEEQARKAGIWFADNGIITFDRMLVSNNTRAMQTAALLGLSGASWMMDFNLRERDGGLFNTITPTLRDTKYVEQQKFYDTQPFLARPPQGESIADVCLRIKIVLDTLARECDGQNVIIVCHGHVMRTFRIILERMSLNRTNEYLTTKEDWGKVPNCSIIHYTRQNPSGIKQSLSTRFDWVRMIRPAGGGNYQDEFSAIERRKFTNEELLLEIA